MGIGDSRWGSIRRWNLTLEVGWADKELRGGSGDLRVKQVSPVGAKSEKNGFGLHFSPPCFHHSEDQLQTDHKNRKTLPAFVTYFW